jgi:hypothetical protein
MEPGQCRIRTDAALLVINSTGPVSYSWTEVSPGSASGSGTFTGPISIITGLPAGATIDVSIGPTNFSNTHRYLEHSECNQHVWYVFQCRRI